jgi:hypothetical protein
MQTFDKRAALLTEQLQSAAGLNPRMDIFNSGYIMAVKDLLLVELEDTEESS